MSTALRWHRRLLTVGVALPLVLLGPAPLADAHPFGDPQTAAVTASGNVVTVQWRIGGLDDLTLLGVELGVLPADRVMLDGAIDFVDGDAASLAASDELGGYLLERIRVSSGHQDCSGRLVDVGDLLDEGARLEFACSDQVDSASVTMRTLTDLHPAYRTLAKGPDGQRAVYETGADTFAWELRSGHVDEHAVPADVPLASGTGDDLGRSAAVQLGAVTAGLLVVMAAGALVLRYRRSHRPPTPTT